MGTTSFNPVVPNNEAWNYGPNGFDRRQNLQINYSYDFPNLGKRLNQQVPRARWWTTGLSPGITSIQTGAPFNPGFNINGTSIDYTGTPDVGARPNVVGNPMQNVPAGSYFNPAAFAPPALGTTSPLRCSATWAVDRASCICRTHKLRRHDDQVHSVREGERRGLRLQAQAYNIFNHTEYIGVNSTIQFSSTGQIQNGASVGVFSVNWRLASWRFRPESNSKRFVSSKRADHGKIDGLPFFFVLGFARPGSA